MSPTLSREERAAGRAAVAASALKAQAGLLTYGDLPALLHLPAPARPTYGSAPSSLEQWFRRVHLSPRGWARSAVHSGGTVADFHGLPFFCSANTEHT